MLQERKEEEEEEEEASPPACPHAELEQTLWESFSPSAAQPGGSQLILNNLNRQRYLHSQPDWWPYKIDLWIEVLSLPLSPIQAIIDYTCCSEIKERKILKKEKKKGRLHRCCSIFSRFPGISRSIHHLFFFFILSCFLYPLHQLLPPPPALHPCPSPPPLSPGSGSYLRRDGGRHRTPSATFPQRDSEARRL